MNKTALPSVLAALLFAASPALAASIALVAPEDGAAYDTHSPCVKEFYDSFEKRGVKPPRPPLNEEEQRLKAEAEAQGKVWYDRYGFFDFNDFTKDLNERNKAEEREWKPFSWTAGGVLDTASSRWRSDLLASGDNTRFYLLLEDAPPPTVIVIK